jgi:prepilin-type processing-associated H-X9-DG protein
MQKLKLHADPLSANFCFCDGHIDISSRLVFAKKFNKSNLLSCTEPLLLLAQETGNSTGPVIGVGIDGRGWGSKSGGKRAAKPSNGCRHTHQGLGSMRYISTLGSSSDGGGRFLFVPWGSDRSNLPIRKHEQKDKI